MHDPTAASLGSLDVDALLHERGTLDPRAYVDPSIHALEQERVFGRSWLLLTHESCLPEPGRFVTARMGEDPIVVTRTDDGTIAAFLNQCRHRGVPICRHEAGRARSFTCSYHGWTYDARGGLLSIPNEARLFRCPVDRGDWSATPVPRIETRHGLVFGCWDPQAPPLQEWLGDARLYFDLAFDAPGGTEALVGVSRRRVAANWKFGAEQFSTDGFHVSFTHASGFAALAAVSPQGDAAPFDVLNPPMTQMHSRHGHGMGFVHDLPAARAQFGANPIVGEWLFGPRLDYLVSKYGEQAREIFPLHMNFFPNTGSLWPNEVRVFNPSGPTHMEFWSWLIVDRQAPDAVKTAMRQDQQRTFGAAGIFEVDDMHNWVEAQRTLTGWQTRQRPFNVEMGTGSAEPTELGLEPVPSEAGARRFHRRWAQLMTTERDAGGPQ